MDSLVASLLELFGVYLVVGLFLGLGFVIVGAKKIDPSAGATGFFFKLLILPGSIILWPYLIGRWIKGRTPSEERSAHRSAAK